MITRIVALFVCLLLLPVSQTVANARAVDVELVLAVDVSGSMDFNELRIQRRGYVEAFRSPEVHRVIEEGLIGAVAVTYVEWARNDLKKVIVPWTLLQSGADALQFADRLEAAEIGNMRNTSISGAIAFGARQLQENAFEGARRVIDISGDGPNNQGDVVTDARDAAVAAGIVINGLPLVTDPWRERFIFRGEGTLAGYYAACVIGGPGSFVIAVDDWSGFPDAVRRKLVLELAGRVPAPSDIVPAQFLDNPLANVDCEIGERRRRERERWGP
ncbi:MAG: DUF1194 domain-containing protein [Pseudomonadota bacterium]